MYRILFLLFCILQLTCSHVPYLVGDEIHAHSIRCILSDMDGTLLNHHHKVSTRSIAAIKMLQKTDIPFFPATGRTRRSMANAGGQELVDLLGGSLDRIGGVYSQGLMVYGPNGKLIYERFLDKEALGIAEDYCEEHLLSLIAYSGDRVFTKRATPYTNMLPKYMEILPEIYADGLQHLSRVSLSPNKLIIMGEEEVLFRHRPHIEQLLHRKASITKAVPGMLEVLPLDASKGHGVSVLLEYCGIKPKNCVAFGDGENDIEMLELVKYGIAMENARDELLRRAFRKTLSNNDDGVATVIEGILSSLGFGDK